MTTFQPTRGRYKARNRLNQNTTNRPSTNSNLTSNPADFISTPLTQTTTPQPVASSLTSPTNLNPNSASPFRPYPFPRSHSQRFQQKEEQQVQPPQTFPTQITPQPFLSQQKQLSSPYTSTPTPPILQSSQQRPTHSLSLRSVPVSSSKYHSAHHTPRQSSHNVEGKTINSSLEYLKEILNFLEYRRPADAEKFAAECAEVYKKNYSTSKKLLREQNLQSQDSILKPTEQDRSRLNPNDEKDPTSQSKAEKPDATTTDLAEVGQNGDVAKGPTTSTEKSQPNNDNPEIEVIEVLSDDEVPPKQVEKSQKDDQPMPKIKHGIFTRRYETENRIRERARYWAEQRRKLDQSGVITADGLNYVIAKPSGRFQDMITLPISFCNGLTGLLDPPRDLGPYQLALLSSIHLDTLRFLWMYLVHDACTGAIFRHGIGYPRAHIILLFAHIALKARTRSPLHRILIVCPPCAVNDWSRTAHALKSSLEIRITITNRNDWSEQIRAWKTDGGVLVCSTEIYGFVLEESSVPQWQQQCLEALCNPGPDIIVLDEATRIGTYNSRVGRLLASTATRARLALTSTPESGNLQRTWNVVNWACPEFCGNKAEFNEVFLSIIADGHKEKSTVKQGALAYRTALILRENLKMVTHTITVDQRRTVLERRGLRLLESSIFVNLSRRHVDLYQSVGEILSDAVADGKMNKFIALHILNITATCPRALLGFLMKGYIGDKQLLDPDTDIHKVFNAAFDTCKAIKLRTDKFEIDELIRGKLELCKFLCIFSLKQYERIVVFTSSKEVFIETVAFLENNVEAEQFFKYDLVEDSGERSNQLLGFNTAAAGAVLVAPIGPLLDCMEESGWGFVNANRVLIIENSFYSDACAQALNRVHSLAQMQTCHVHYIQAKGTVDETTFTDIKTRFESVKGDAPGEWRRPPTAKNPIERSYLLTPVVNDKVIQKSRCDFDAVRYKMMDVHESRNTFERQRLEDDLSFNECLKILEEKHSADEGYLVHKVELGGDKYNLLSQALDVAMKATVSEEERKTARTEIIRRQESLFETFASTMKQLVIWGREDHPIRAVDSVKIDPDTFIEEEDDPWGIISCWDSYYRTYECPPPEPKVLREKSRGPNGSRSRSSQHSAHGSGDRREDVPPGDFRPPPPQRMPPPHLSPLPRRPAGPPGPPPRGFGSGRRQMPDYVDYDEPPSQLVIADRVNEDTFKRRRRR